MRPRNIKAPNHLLIAAAVALFGASAHAELSLDTSFGANGTALFSLGSQPNLDQHAHGIAVDADGKTLLAATVDTQIAVHLFTRQLGVVRLNTDGTPDTTFASRGGTNIVACPPEVLERNVKPGAAIAIQNDERIVMAATCDRGDQIVVVRLLPNGELDNSFDGDGMAFFPPLYRPGGANALAVQADGLIVVAGSFDGHAAVWRLQDNGAIDTTFGTNGAQTLAVASEYRSIEIMSDGRIVVAGTTDYTPPGSPTSNRNFLLTRLTPSGAIDTTFNGGVQSFNVGLLPASTNQDEPTDDEINSLALRPDGTVLVAARTIQATGAILAQFTSDGLLDAAFGDGGYVALGDSSTAPLDVVLLSDGVAVVVGDRSPTQVSASGLHASSYPSLLAGNSIARQSDDKVVVARQWTGLSYGIAVTRLVTGAIPDETPEGFDFIDVDNAELNVSVVSAPITIEGVETSVDASVAGGEFSIGCGDTWVAPGATRAVDPGDTVCVRHTTGSTSLSRVDTVLTVGGVAGTFSSVTGDADPDRIVFPAMNRVPRQTVIVAGPVTITGITIAAPVRVMAGEFSVGCGLQYSAEPATVRNGQAICVRHTSSADHRGTMTTLLFVGETSAPFVSTTRGGGGGSSDWLVLAFLIAILVLRDTHMTAEHRSQKLARTSRTAQNHRGPWRSSAGTANVKST